MKPHIRLLALLALGGCASTTPGWDRHFGATVALTVEAQRLDPAAATRPHPGDSLDGRTAKLIQERYEKSFSEPAPPDSMLSTGLAK
jgi:hypothetical protein